VVTLPLSIIQGNRPTRVRFRERCMPQPPNRAQSPNTKKIRMTSPPARNIQIQLEGESKRHLVQQRVFYALALALLF